jgi:hypothetical protein
VANDEEEHKNMSLRQIQDTTKNQMPLGFNRGQTNSLKNINFPPLSRFGGGGSSRFSSAKNTLHTQPSTSMRMPLNEVFEEENDYNSTSGARDLTTKEDITVANDSDTDSLNKDCQLEDMMSIGGDSDAELQRDGQLEKAMSIGN